MFDRTARRTYETSAFARKLQHALGPGSAELAALEAMPGNVRSYRRGDIVLPAGERLQGSAIILSGLVTRAIYMRDGRRQILGIGIPGDFLAGRSGDGHRTTARLVAAAPSAVLFLEPGMLGAMARQLPGLEAALDWVTDRELADAARQIERLGRHAARGRITHFLLDLFYRHRLAGLTEAGAVTLPLTQSDIADASGLSLVHVNKTLASLEQCGMLRRRRSRVELVDIPGLAEICALPFEAFMDVG